MSHNITDTPNNHINGEKKLIAGKILPAILSFLVLVSLDQFTKYLVDHHMALYDSIPLVKDLFELHYIRNYGAAWGLLQNKQLLFYLCTVFVCIAGIFLYIRCSKLQAYQDIQLLIVLILSGAVGNFIDRIRFKYVIDFLYFKLIDFPVFNIADCYVTIGFILMIILLFFKYGEEDLEKLLSLTYEKSDKTGHQEKR
ncbi:MAG: signal peptidase II [Bacteroidales bacterium]|nr:signal peptidase II [Clostridium sp.]MCM1204908.1 signal peptidase II [Bacteroidales bacterium]